MIANWIRNTVFKDDCPDSGCGIKVYWREAFLRLPFFTCMHRFMPALFQINGYQVAYEPVNDRPRLAGHRNTPISVAPSSGFTTFSVSSGCASAPRCRGSPRIPQQL